MALRLGILSRCLLGWSAQRLLSDQTGPPALLKRQGKCSFVKAFFPRPVPYLSDHKWNEPSLDPGSD